MKKTILALCLLLCCAACSRKESQPEAMKEVEVDLKQTTGDEYCLWTDLLEDEEFVALESAPQCMLSKILRIEYYEDHYYILDLNQNAVLVFDAGGKFVRKIGRLGKGHGEYLSVSDFTIDREGKRVVILGGMSAPSTVYVYGPEGDFLLQKKLDESLLWNIASGSEGFLATTNHYTYTEGEHAFLFYFFDKDFNRVSKHTPVLPKQMGMSAMPAVRLKAEGDRFVYTDVYTQRVYVLDESGRAESCLHYAMDKPMQPEGFADANAFMRAQMESAYMLEHIVADDRSVLIYMQPGEPRIALTDPDGEVVLNEKYVGVVPHFYLSEDDRFLSAFSSDELPELPRRKPNSRTPQVHADSNFILV